MKLLITDKFLWDLYKLMEKSGDVTNFVFRRRRTMYDVLPGPKNPIFDKYRRESNKEKFHQLIYYLKRKNYIKVKNLEGNQTIMLTKEGLSKVLKSSFKLERKNKRADGKWIMLTFDIPEKHKKARKLLRSVLHNLDYKMFQQSIWVTPYDVFEKTEKLLQSYSLDQYVRIFLVEEIK